MSHSLKAITLPLLGLLLHLCVAPESALAQESLHAADEVQVDGKPYPYRLLSPADIVEGQRYPLVLFLHGMGERGSDNKAQLRHFPERMATEAYRKAFPCYVLSPQCPDKVQWANGGPAVGTGSSVSEPASAPMRAAIAALKKVIAANPIDMDRIYLTGLSMGGAGAWDLASRHPSWFAAAAPICGWGDAKAGARLAGLPISVWHGGADRLVKAASSRLMVKAIEAAGGNVVYHELKGVGHNSWVKAYGSEGCLEWMFKMRRDPAAELDVVASSFVKACKATERVAFLGDSITQAGNRKDGYLDLLRSALLAQHKKAAVIPAGISGHKVPDLLRRYKKDVMEKAPTLVFIYIGINDVWHSTSGRGTPIDEFESGLREMIEEMHAAQATVVLATPSVIGELAAGANKLDALLDEYAAVSRKVAADMGVVLCDLRAAFHDHLSVFNTAGVGRGVLTSDGVHLNPAGNVFLATQAARAMAVALENRE